MSKLSKRGIAKVAQGYVPKAVPKTCANCVSFHSDFVEHPAGTYQVRVWIEEKNLRCIKGEFAVRKMGTCNEFVPTGAPA